MGAETPEMQPGQGSPEGALGPPKVPVDGLRSVLHGTLFLGPRSSFWVAGAGRGGTQLLLFFPEESNEPVPRTLSCSQRLHAGM